MRATRVNDDYDAIPIRQDDTQHRAEPSTSRCPAQMEAREYLFVSGGNAAQAMT